MATNLKTFDSFGGFSVNNSTVINDLNDAKNINSLEIKNRSFTDSSTTQYILRGLNTSILSLNQSGSQILLPSDTINFVTSHIIGVNDTGGGHYSVKIESCVSVDNSGNVQELSSMRTIIKDSVPSGQTWTVTPFDTGSANRYSYSVVRAGTTSQIKWVASVQVVSIAWT